MIDPKRISKHKVLSLFDEADFYKLIEIIKHHSNLIILPNIWTEVDNSMNRSVGEFKNKYVEICKELAREIKENYLASSIGFESDSIYDLGLTDSLLLEWIKEQGHTLISIDSKLCDIAKAYNLKTIDLIKDKNDFLFKI